MKAEVSGQYACGECGKEITAQEGKTLPPCPSCHRVEWVLVDETGVPDTEVESVPEPSDEETEPSSVYIVYNGPLSRIALGGVGVLRRGEKYGVEDLSEESVARAVKGSQDGSFSNLKIVEVEEE